MWACKIFLKKDITFLEKEISFLPTSYRSSSKQTRTNLLGNSKYSIMDQITFIIIGIVAIFIIAYLFFLIVKAVANFIKAVFQLVVIVIIAMFLILIIKDFAGLEFNWNNPDDIELSDDGSVELKNKIKKAP